MLYLLQCIFKRILPDIFTLVTLYSRFKTRGSLDDYVSTLRLWFAHDIFLRPILASCLLIIVWVVCLRQNNEVSDTLYRGIALSVLIHEVTLTRSTIWPGSSG